MSSPTRDFPAKLRGRMSHVPLPADILAGFDINIKPNETSSPQLLSGGEGTTYHIPAANVVLKPARDVAETELICNILSQLTITTATNNADFQISQPLRSKSGSFVHNGWSASLYIPNARSLNQQKGDYTLARFAEIIRVSNAFHAALQRVKLSDAETQRLRTGHTHVWARAHRAVWDTETDPQRLLEPFLMGRALDKAHPYMELTRRLIDLGEKLGDAPKQNVRLFETASQVIHGDIVGGDNILFSTDTSTSPRSTDKDIGTVLSSPPPPVVIDLSPTLAPASYAEGILLADGLIWCGVGLEILDLAGGRTPQRVDMVRRGLLFRCLSDIGLIERGHDAARPDMVENERVTGLLEEEVMVVVAGSTSVVDQC